MKFTCREYRRGDTCKYGNKCRFLHDKPGESILFRKATVDHDEHHQEFAIGKRDSRKKKRARPDDASFRRDNDAYYRNSYDREDYREVRDRDGKRIRRY